MVINRNSWGYWCGKIAAKAVLLTLGYFIGKKYTQRPIDKGYPEKKPNPTPKK